MKDQVRDRWWTTGADLNIVNLIAGVVAIGLMTLTAIMVLVILFRPIPAENETLVGQAFGTVLSLLGIVVGFFYGTSTTSKRDRESINTLVEATKKNLPNVEPDVLLKPGDSVVVESEADK